MITNNISVETTKPVSADKITVASFSDIHRTTENQIVNDVKHSEMVYQDGALQSTLHVNRDTASKSLDTLPNNCSTKEANFRTPSKLTRVKTYGEKSNVITNNISVETTKPVSTDRVTVASLSDTHRTTENQLVNDVKHSGMVY